MFCKNFTSEQGVSEYKKKIKKNIKSHVMCVMMGALWCHVSHLIEVSQLMHYTREFLVPEGL